MAELGEIRAKLVAETAEFEAGMGRAADAAGQAAGAVDEVQKSVKAINWREAGQSMAAMGGQLKGIGDQFLDAADRADALTDRLKGAFGDQAAEVNRWSQEIGTAFGVFSADQVAGAATALQTFGATSEASLRRVADIAAGTGMSIESVAASYGKFEKFGDSKSLMALQKTLGVTADELGKFGAVLDSNGKILADTPARTEAARLAMEQLLDEKFAGGMERMSGGGERIAGAMELLKQEVGASSLAFRDSFEPAILAAIDGMRGLSPEIKGAIGLATEFGGTALMVGGQGLQMAANLSTLGLSLTGIKTAMMAVAGAGSSMVTGFLAMGGPIGILIVSLGALAVGLAATLAEMEKANKAAEDLLSTEEKRARNLAKHKDLIGKSTDELKKMGATQKDVNELIDAMRDGLEKAGTEEQKSKIRVQIGALRDSRDSLPTGAAPPPAAPGAPAPSTRVEESAKQKAAREKKEASQKAAAERKAEQARIKAQKDRERAQRQAENKRRQDEAKRNRDRTAAERDAERKRVAREKAAEREAAKAEKERAKQQSKAESKTEKKTEKAEEKKAAAASSDAPAGFFDKFAQDANTTAFKDIMAKNAARAAASSDVFVSDTPSTLGSGPMGAFLSGLTQAAINPAAAAAVSSAASATTPGASGVADEKQQAASGTREPDTLIVLEIRDQAGKSLRQESKGPGPHKFNLTAPLGGLSG